MSKNIRTSISRKHGYTTDSGMLRRMADEEERAWMEFDAKYRSMICAIGRKRDLTPSDCEDLVQEVMLVCCRRIGHFFYDRRRGRFRSWLNTVARNIIWQQQRKKPIPQPDCVPEYDDGINLSFMMQYEQFLLDSCLARLKESVSMQTYAAFEMLCIQQLPTEEVSRITRKSPAALYQVRHRCLRILRKCIAEIPEAADRIHARSKSDD